MGVPSVGNPRASGLGGRGRQPLAAAAAVGFVWRGCGRGRWSGGGGAPGGWHCIPDGREKLRGQGRFSPLCVHAPCHPLVTSSVGWLLCRRRLLTAPAHLAVLRSLSPPSLPPPDLPAPPPSLPPYFASGLSLWTVCSALGLPVSLLGWVRFLLMAERFLFFLLARLCPCCVYIPSTYAAAPGRPLVGARAASGGLTTDGPRRSLGARCRGCHPAPLCPPPPLSFLLLRAL